MISTFTETQGVTSVQATGALPVCGTAGTPSLLALANPNYYVNFSLAPRLDSNYAGYTVRAGSASVQSPRIVLGNFTGGSVALAPGQEPAMSLPALPAGGTHTSYFLLQASTLTASPQTHTATLFNGASALCERTFTFNRVADTIRANANKVRSVTADVPSEVRLGDVVTVTVQGDTGVLGSGPSFDPGVLSYAPTAFSDFPASAWRLERTEMQISPDGSAPAQTYLDRLFLAGASGSDRPYTAKYTFRAVGPTPTPSSVLPVQYIASGTQVKHTSVSDIGIGALPSVASDSSLTLAKMVSPAEFPLDHNEDPTGGTVFYTVVASNSGGSSGTIDEIVDNSPAGVTYSAGTARINNRLVAPVVTGTVATGQTLTWYGPFSVPAGGQLRVTYEVAIPATPGTYVNSVIGRYGTQIIDASESLEANTPATATVTVRGSVGGDPTPTLAVPALTATTPAGQSVTVSSSAANITISALATSPLNGTPTIADGVLTYTPNAGFAGVDEFDYVGTDGTETGINTITITVSSVDLIARPDVFVVLPSSNQASQTYTLNVCTNDQFPQDTCVVSTVGATTPVVPGLGSNGTFVYTAPTSTGIHDFHYLLLGLGGDQVPGSVRIYVSNRLAQFGTTPFGTKHSRNFSLNGIGSDPEYGHVTRRTGQDQGTDYDPWPLGTGNSDKAFWGIDGFVYNDTGGSAPYRILVAPPSLTIAAQVGQPVAKSLTDTTFLASQVAPSTFIVNCPGCLFEVSTPAQHGTFSINENTGAFTYLPDAGTTESADTVVVKITDMASPADKNMFVYGTINFTISEFVEVVANDDSFSLLAGASGTFNVATNDRCPEGCQVETVNLPAGITQTATTGAFTVAPGVTLGAQTFLYTLRSTKTASVTDSATVTVIVEGAVSDSATTAPGQMVTIPVLDNDPCGTLTGVNCVLHAVTGVAVGTATISGTTIEYNPPAWFAGATAFTYVVRATNGSTSSAQVTVNVIQAVNDTFTVSSNVATTLDPLANDLCVDCRITSTSTGTIVDEGFGLQVTATSNTTETYEITDAGGATSSATIALTVAAPPVAVNDQVTTSAGVAVTVDVLANDKRTAGSANCLTSCSAEILSDPANGSVSLRADGTLQYSPRGDFAGVDTFTYLVINDFGLTDTATVTVQVYPVANDDAYTLGTNLGNRVLSVMANDVCASCTLAVSAVAGTGVDAVSVDGPQIRVTTSATSGVATFTYTLAVGALTDTATVTVTVSDASPDAATTSAGTAVTIDVITNDAFSNTTVTSVTAPTPTGSATSAGDVTVTFTPEAGFSGLAEFTYTTADNTSATVSVLVAPATLSVTTDFGVSVSGVALMPTACPDCEVTVVAGSDAGDLESDGAGTYLFTPAEAYSGTDDDLRYEIHHVPTGLRVLAAVEFTVNTPVAALTAGLELTTGITSNGTGVGDPATVTYTVTNSGTATLSAVTLEDPLVTSAFTCGVAYPISPLAPGATEVCTATFPISQAQLDAGLVTSNASVGATSAVVNVTDPATVSATSSLVLAGTAALEFSKTAAVDIAVAAPADQLSVGDRIDFTFTVTNSGTTTLSDIQVSDPSLSMAATPCPDLAAVAPGVVRTCSAQLTVTQAHLDAGGVTNSATVAAVATGGRVNPQGGDTVFVPLIVTPEVTISAVGPANPTVSAVGETLAVSYTVTNNGPVALENLTVVVSGGTISCVGSGNGAIAALAVGATHTCTVQHTITQGDFDVTEFAHSATVSGVTAAGVQASASTSVIVPFVIESAQSGQTDPPPPPPTPPPPSANQLPRINPDRVSAPMGAVVSLRPLANDEGQNLRITSITAPNVGFAQLVGDTVTLTPPLFHVGPISVTYTATDGQNSGSAQISVSMTDNGALLLPEMFLDMNRNGRRDPGEPGIPQVRMALTQTARAQLVVQPDGSLRLASMRTAAVGSSFSLFATATGGCTTNPTGICLPPSMPAGSYLLDIIFDPEIHGMDMTASPAGTVGLTSGVDLSGLDEIRPAFGFGFAGPGSIVANVGPEQWAEVVWAGVDGEFGTDDDMVILVRGDANGEISVPGLPKGSYLIRPAGSGATSMGGGTVSGGDTEGMALVEVDGAAPVRVNVSTPVSSGRLPTVGSEIEALGRLSLLFVSVGTLLALVGGGSRRRRRVEVM